MTTAKELCAPDPLNPDMEKALNELGIGSPDGKGGFVSTKKGDRLDRALLRHATGLRISTKDRALLKEYYDAIKPFTDENGRELIDSFNF